MRKNTVSVLVNFPGGGLELGEGLIDGLKREFVEECAAEIDVLFAFLYHRFF